MSNYTNQDQKEKLEFYNTVGCYR